MGVFLPLYRPIRTEFKALCGVAWEKQFKKELFCSPVVGMTILFVLVINHCL